MFCWKEDFSVKIPLIDEQHKILFEIGSSIHELLREYKGQDSFDEIVVQIEKLTKYTKYHFTQEEKMMLEYGYEDVGDHIIEHRKFIEYLNALDYNSVDENQEEALVELVKFITSWVFKHIMNVDFKYSDFIISRMNKSH